MQEAINKLLANGLQDLAGLKIHGRIALTESAINRLVQEYLEQLNQAKEEDTAPAPKQAFDLAVMIQHLKQLKMEAQAGRVLVHLDYEVEPKPVDPEAPVNRAESADPSEKSDMLNPEQRSTAAKPEHRVPTATEFEEDNE